MSGVRRGAALALSAALAAPALAPALEGRESPEVAAAVAEGRLPPVHERLPGSPRVMPMASMGSHGGELRLLMGRAKDVRMMTVYGYARLAVFDQNLEIQPDILEAIEVEDGRVFTLRLRDGHRWSDGAPFTSEDFRYWWEDIASNRELSAFGLAPHLLVDGEGPRVEFPDPLTVRYAWPAPNPFFLPALAGTLPLYIYAPAHYLKQFHVRYVDPEALAARAKEEGRRDWTDVHIERFQPYKNSNPELPTLEPWRVVTPSPATRYVFERNPFYHRVDADGRQLPYVDRVIMNIADGKLIPAKTGAGETDLQSRHLNFSDYTFLKASESRTDIRVRLWETTRGAHFALFPNLNVRDPVWRALVRDVRFRRALSLAIDRHEINQVIYFGLAVEGNNTVHRDSPLYKERYRSDYAVYDPDQATALLDEIGLTARGPRGIRLLPDGRPLEIVVETAGEDTEQSDVLELIESTWRAVGVKLFTKPLQREVLRNRVFGGQSVMSVWSGLENGLPTPDMSPEELAPTSQQHLQWSMWGQYYETRGATGEAPDMEPAVRLLALNREWLRSATREQRSEIWHAMLAIHARQVFTIGVVSAVPQPVVVNRWLHNVPEKGIHNWEPGAYFGIYAPDTFWFERAR